MNKEGAEGVYLNNNHFIVFNGSKIRDIEFTSPSLAAALVYGQNSNGRTSWKLQDGTTLDDYIKNIVMLIS